MRYLHRFALLTLLCLLPTFSEPGPLKLTASTFKLTPLYSFPLSFPLLQPASGGFVTVRFWDGTNLINGGDFANNAIRVNVVAGGGAGGTSSTFGAAFPGTGTAAGFFDGTNMQGGRVFDLDSGGGTQYGLGVNLRFAGAGGSTEAAADTVNNAFRVNCVTGCVAGGSFADAAAFTFGTTTVSNTAFVVDDTAPNTVAENSAGAARMNTNRILYTMSTGPTGAPAIDDVGTGQPASVSVMLVGGFDPSGGSTRQIAVDSVGRIQVGHTDDSPGLNATVVAVGFRADETTPDSVDEGDIGVGRMSLNRNAYFQLRDGESGAERGAAVTAANAVKVDGSAVTQPVSGPLTDAQLRATPVPVSGTVATGGLTDAELRATPVPVSGSGNFNAVGTKTNNGGAPGATNLGTLPAVANAAAPTHTEGNQVAHRVQLDGDLVMVMEDELPAGTQNIGDVDVVTLPTVTIGTFPDNEPINVAQINGVAPAMDNGVSGTGVQRVTLASDSTGTVIATQATAANLNVRPDTSGATAAAPPARADYIGGLTSGATGGFLAGVTVCNTFANVDIVTATTTLAITGVSGRHVYICSINLVTAGANNVAIIAGTTTTTPCDTSAAGLNGGTTAAEGWNFAANGGLTQGSGFGAVLSTNGPSGAATGDNVCIVTSAAVQLSGVIGYAIY